MRQRSVWRMPSSRCFTIYKNFTPPILDDGTTVYDRWTGNKSVSKKAWEPPLMWLVWKILRDLYHSPLTGKLHSQTEIYLCFKAASSGTCLVFASNHGFSTLPSKATVRESPHSFLQSTKYESIIVILSVTCILPKYHIVFCMLVMFLTLSSEFYSPLKLRRSFFIYVLLHS